MCFTIERCCFYFDLKTGGRFIAIFNLIYILAQAVTTFLIYGFEGEYTVYIFGLATILFFVANIVLLFGIL